MKVIVSMGREHEADAVMREDIAALDRRGDKARRVGWRALLAGAFLATWAAFAAFGLDRVAPDGGLRSIHLPAEVVHAIEAKDPESAENANMVATFDSLSMLLTSMLVFIALCSSGWFLGRALRDRSFAPDNVLRSIAWTLVSLTTAVVVNFTTEQLIGEHVLAMAKRGEYDWVEKKLRVAEMPVGNRMQAYVLAQTALMRASAKGLPLATAHVDTARAIAADLVAGKSADVSPRAMHALEARALGSPVSPQAKAYAVEAAGVARRWQWMLHALAASATLALALGVATYSAGAAMQRRAERLRALLGGTSQHVDVSHA